MAEQVCLQPCYTSQISFVLALQYHLLCYCSIPSVFLYSNDYDLSLPQAIVLFSSESSVFDVQLKFRSRAALAQDCGLLLLVHIAIFDNWSIATC